MPQYDDKEELLQNWLAGVKRTCTKCEDLPKFASRKELHRHRMVCHRGGILREGA